jgi:hypothetical protein
MRSLRRTGALPVALFAAALVLVAGVASGSSGGPPGRATQVSRPIGGIAAGGVEPWNPRRPADYAAMRTAGLTWLRTDLDWRFLEPVRGEWHFSLYDPVVRDAKAAGLRGLGILHTTPKWANGGAGDHAPPADPALLTEYCHRTVRHYLPLGVTAFEIGNEVNLPGAGRPRPDGAAYTRQVLLPCVAGVRRAADEAGIDATVILGSLVPTDRGRTVPELFLADVYAAGGRGHFDAVSLHPYTGADSPRISDKLTAGPAKLHRVMAAHGDGRMRIWATEFGYPTAGGNAVTETQQGDFVAPAMDAWFAHPYAGPLFWYSARDSGTERLDREEHFGLLRRDGTRKPGYFAVARWFR